MEGSNNTEKEIVKEIRYLKISNFFGNCIKINILLVLKLL